MRLKLATRWALLLCAAVSSLALPAPELTSTKALAVRASTDLSKRALEDYFWVKPGKMDQGGCFDAVGSGDTTTFKDKLDKAREEALTIADGAVDALKMLLEDKPKEDDSASKEEYNKAMKWRKAQKSIFDLFAIEVDEREKPTGDVRNKIDSMIKDLEAFTETRNQDPPAELKKKPRIYCGDQGFSWVEPNAESPLKSKKKAGPDGAWYARGAADKDKTKSIPAKLMDVKPGGSRDSFCKPELKHTAVTLESDNIMVFCDQGLKYTTTQEEQKGSIKEGTELTTVRSLSRTFLHESLHLESQLSDPPIVTFKKGAEIQNMRMMERR
ncbi:hypothetical protein GTA08_BOTSDO11189 [Botryosphaeria dothidea]|uniref:Lysine-specific metallo-endopeptidase domain-containing protein n=1 Tax=Botryosphaeria dothidea TaxID=55169 RepID=A0A8H4N094_9PEZI|nr:hypothetical protein GTA08_BOTSDO11189 [Botryosphaeria dothidea]